MAANYKVYFYPEKRKDKAGQLIKKDVPIVARFTCDGKRFVLSTGLKADLRQWDTKNQKFKSSASNAHHKNSVLDELTIQLEAIYLSAKAKGRTVDGDYIRAKMKGTDQNDFLTLFDEFIRNESKVSSWANSTLAKFSTLRRHLVTMRSNGLPLEFSAVSYDWYQKIFDYFIEAGHSNATIKKNIKNVNWFLQWCITNKAIKIPDFKSFVVKDKAAHHQTAESIVFLRPDEFLHVFNAHIVNHSLEIVRDLFCFLCATGMRVSDLQRLRARNVSNDVITITTAKTGDAISIPLNDFSRSILDKYKDYPLLEGGRVLPSMHEVNINRYLKTLGQQLGLNRTITKTTTHKGELIRQDKPLHELLTTHVGRRTFVSLSIALNVNSSVLMRFTGHQNAQTLAVYTGISDDQKRREMDNFSPERLLKIV